MDQQTAHKALEFFNRATHHISGHELPDLVRVANALHAAAQPPKVAVPPPVVDRSAEVSGV
ncbi:MAG: hypothetical protein OEW08_04510 [Gammaproteobacteria bacterium]|nr:hypothetical protein [Gammaproteobacteria bacterium]